MFMAQIHHSQREEATQCPSAEESADERCYSRTMKSYLPVKGTDNWETPWHRWPVKTCGGRSQTHEAARHVTSSTGNTVDPEAEGGAVVPGPREEGAGSDCWRARGSLGASSTSWHRVVTMAARRQKCNKQHREGWTLWCENCISIFLKWWLKKKKKKYLLGVNCEESLCTGHLKPRW